LTARAFSPEKTSGLEGAPVPPGHAYISEMFSGIQGEGPWVGVRQVFVRLAGCDLRCWWCDTPKSLVRRGPGRTETARGSREFRPIENPVPLDHAAGLLAALEPAEHHSVTFTGGEPLLQSDAVLVLGEEVRGLGGRTWLETHGGRVRELELVMPVMDFISMDIKLPSSSGDFIPLDVHRDFLQIASAAEVYAKVVVTPETSDDQLLDAAAMVGSVDSDVILVLQPVTPFGRVRTAPSPDRMLEVQALCLNVHRNVRVIPQTHKLSRQL
jgi:7-carboxy-7-deazaguanine synthase